MSTATATRKQTKTYGPVVIDYCGEPATLRATAKWEALGNQEPYFSITGDITQKGKWQAGGCLHEEIAANIPTLAPFIKWHLCSLSGPMHYPANAVYLAGDKDCWGYAAGEQKVSSRDVLPMWTATAETPRGLPSGVTAAEQPATYAPSMGEGKERQLDAARSSAVWEDATDEELSVPAEQLKQALMERLPALQAEFKDALIELGFDV